MQDRLRTSPGKQTKIIEKHVYAQRARELVYRSLEAADQAEVSRAALMTCDDPGENGDTITTRDDLRRASS